MLVGMIVYANEDKFCCLKCRSLISVKADGTPTFCEQCKTLYWVEGGKLQIRVGHPVDDDMASQDSGDGHCHS